MKDIALIGELNQNDYESFGKKASYLGEISKMGLPVAPGFVISRDIVSKIISNEGIPETLKDPIRSYMKKLENITRKKFGDPSSPLIVSVRSSPISSQPGILTTILNVGINEKIAFELNKKHGGTFGLINYMKFIYMLGSNYHEKIQKEYDKVLEETLKSKEAKSYRELTRNDIIEVIDKYKKIFTKLTKKNFPESPYDQLYLSLYLVAKSWTSKNAIAYRRKNNIDDEELMGIIIQEVKFGDLNDLSLSGIAFSSDPNNGDDELVGDYLNRIQGDEIVLGKMKTKKIIELKSENASIYEQLYSYAKKLEIHFKDVIDMEFTVENNKLWIFQVRPAKLSPLSMLKVYTRFYERNIISEEELIAKLDAQSLKRIMFPTLKAESKMSAISENRQFFVGIGASPGIGVGNLIFISKDSDLQSIDVKGKIIVVEMLKPHTVMKLRSASGVLVYKGGSSSHAIILARSIGLPVVIIGNMPRFLFSIEQATISNGRVTLTNGDLVTIDGTTGEIYIGRVEYEYYNVNPLLKKIVNVAKGFIDQIHVRCNVEDPNDLNIVNYWDIKHINVRTEIREFIKRYILSIDDYERERVIELMKDKQTKFFEKFIEKFNGESITFKFIDPPFQEFLPEPDELLVELYEKKCRDGVIDENLQATINRIREMKNVNPMLGLRGIRLGIVFPEIYETQLYALLDALFNTGHISNTQPVVRILLPNVINAKEIAYIRKRFETIIERYNEMNNTNYKIPIGVVIETPVSVYNLTEISKVADFLIIGTNDLTQTFLSIGRTDSERFFLNNYLELKILERNPFLHLDESLYNFLKDHINRVQKNNEEVEIGVAGEHAVDPESIEKFYNLKLDYISVPPIMIPISIISLAKIHLLNRKDDLVD